MQHIVNAPRTDKLHCHGSTEGHLETLRSLVHFRVVAFVEIVRKGEVFVIPLAQETDLDELNVRSLLGRKVVPCVAFLQEHAQHTHHERNLYAVGIKSNSNQGAIA